MDIFLTVLSFPLWFSGFIFVVVGLFGTIKINGVPTYDQKQYTIRTAISILGVLFLIVAYAMTRIAG